MEEENGAKNINPKVDNKWNNYKTFVIDLRLFLWSMLYIRNRMTLVTSGPMDPWVVDCSKKFWGWSSLDWLLVTGLEMHWWTPFYISILGMSALVYWTWDKILLTIIGRCHPPEMHQMTNHGFAILAEPLWRVAITRNYKLKGKPLPFYRSLSLSE